MSPRTLIYTASLAGAIAAMSCGGGDSPSNDAAKPCQPRDYASFAASKPVTLEKGVLPVARTSCALTSCHGQDNPPAGLYLGPYNSAPTAEQLDRVYQGLVNKKAKEVASMMLVVPSDPQRSYLLRKVDGTQGAGDLACTVDTGDPLPCGSSMPPGYDCNDATATDRQVFRDWVAGGAKKQ